MGVLHTNKNRELVMTSIRGVCQGIKVLIGPDRKKEKKSIELLLLTDMLLVLECVKDKDKKKTYRAMNFGNADFTSMLVLGSVMVRDHPKKERFYLVHEVIGTPVIACRGLLCVAATMRTCLRGQRFAYYCGGGGGRITCVIHEAGVSLI